MPRDFKSFSQQEITTMAIEKSGMMRDEIFIMICFLIYPNKNPFQMASKNQIDMFDKALGTDEIRKIFSRRFKANDLNSLFFKDVNKFRESARKYYLYE